MRVGQVGGSGDALIVQAPARITWTVRMPRQSRLTGSAALMPSPTGTTSSGVVLRLGVSNDRTYERFWRLALDRASEARWQPIDIDLSAYSGWKFSVFYQPPLRDWKLVLSVDAAPGGTVAIAQPLIR